MKSKNIITVLVIIFFSIFMLCDTADGGPKVRQGQKQSHGLLESQSSSALSVLDSFTLRSKLNSGDVYTLSVYQGLNDTVRVNSNQVTPVISDYTWYYKGDGSYSNGTFSVPSGNGKYWIVYFDPSETPGIQNGGPVCDITCNCEECDIEIKNYQEPTEGCKCTGSCPNGDEDPVDCKEASSKTPFVIIKAEVLIFNNAIYN